MAAGQFHVEPRELRGYSSMLERAAGHFTSIERHARDKGGDTSGFTGLLALLVPVVNGIVGLYADALRHADRKIAEVKDALNKTADSYQRHDRAGAENITSAGVRLRGGH